MPAETQLQQLTRLSSDLTQLSYNQSYLKSELEKYNKIQREKNEKIGMIHPSKKRILPECDMVIEKARKNSKILSWLLYGVILVLAAVVLKLTLIDRISFDWSVDFFKDHWWVLFVSVDSVSSDPAGVLPYMFIAMAIWTAILGYSLLDSKHISTVVIAATTILFGIVFLIVSIALMTAYSSFGEAILEVVLYFFLGIVHWLIIGAVVTACNIAPIVLSILSISYFYNLTKEHIKNFPKRIEKVKQSFKYKRAYKIDAQNEPERLKAYTAKYNERIKAINSDIIQYNERLSSVEKNITEYKKTVNRLQNAVNSNNCVSYWEKNTTSLDNLIHYMRAYHLTYISDARKMMERDNALMNKLNAIKKEQEKRNQELKEMLTKIDTIEKNNQERHNEIVQNVQSVKAGIDAATREIEYGNSKLSDIKYDVGEINNKLR